MTQAADKVTRMSSDLVDSAMAEGRRQNRTGRQQLEHWARVGRAVSGQHTAARRRVESALAGTLPLRELGPEEAAVFTAEVDAAIETSLASTDFTWPMANRGITTVALDDDGTIVEHHPDGSITPLAG